VTGTQGGSGTGRRYNDYNSKEKNGNSNHLEPLANNMIDTSHYFESSGGCRHGRMKRSLWVLAAIAGGIIVSLAGCQSGNSDGSSGTPPKRALEILKIQSSAEGDGHSPIDLIDAGGDMAKFFETSKPFPHTVQVELAQGEKEGVSSYALVTGNHGDDSLLRMPRAWTLSGSQDAASWGVVDEQDDPRPWALNEERAIDTSGSCLRRAARRRFSGFTGFDFTRTEPGSNM
jgi:hypothetical protein